MSEWSWTTIGELTSNFDSLRRPVKSSDRKPGATPYYGASGIIDWVDGYTHDGEYLLVAEDGENLRSRNTPIAFMSRGKAWVNNHAHVVTANHRSHTRFLEYLLAQTDVLGYLTGSAQPKLSRSSLDSIRVRVPALSEQVAIAEILGALDDKIAANSELATIASELAGLIYDRSAARFYARPMGDVLTPVLGGTPARSRADFWGGDQLWASAKDITGARFGVVLSTDEKITEAAVAGTKAKPLPAGSVILTARGTVGAVARLAAPASFNQSCYGFVPGDIPPGVLYFAITRAVLRAKEIAHGSVFDTITMKTFDHLPFPDFDTEALTATESEIGPLLEVAAGVVRENSSLAATRDILLPQLMSGKLRVKDAEKVLENAGV
jgi:type I restriction enzyme, S subunit